MVRSWKSRSDSWLQSNRMNEWEMLALLWIAENFLSTQLIGFSSLVVNQWNWDSAIVSAGWAVFDEERGWEELEFLFSDQWADGMVASINFHKFSNTYFPGPEIWGTPEKPSKTTGISQPPVAALAARFMYEHAEQQDLARSKIEELFPKLLAWHRWWYKVRNYNTHTHTIRVHNNVSLFLWNPNSWTLIANFLKFELSCSWTTTHEIQRVRKPSQSVLKKPSFSKPISKFLEVRIFLLLDYNTRDTECANHVNLFWKNRRSRSLLANFLKLKNSCSWMCRPGIQRTKVWLQSCIHGSPAWTTAPRGTRLWNSLSTSCHRMSAKTSTTWTPTCALPKTHTTITSRSYTGKPRLNKGNVPSYKNLFKALLD